MEMFRERVRTIGISLLGGNSGISGPYELGIESIRAVNEEDVPLEAVPGTHNFAAQIQRAHLPSVIALMQVKRLRMVPAGNGLLCNGHVMSSSFLAILMKHANHPHLWVST